MVLANGAESPQRQNWKTSRKYGPLPCAGQDIEDDQRPDGLPNSWFHHSPETQSMHNGHCAVESDYLF